MEWLWWQRRFSRARPLRSIRPLAGTLKLKLVVLMPVCRVSSIKEKLSQHTPSPVL